MPDDAGLNELLHTASEHVRELIRQAYEAGRKAGENEAKQKILSLFSAVEPPSAPMPNANARERGSLAELASVSRPLRDLIFTMDIDKEGVGSNEVLEAVKRRPELDFDIWQVRAGMKTLEKRGILVRVSRGRYRPSEPLLDQSEVQTREATISGELFGDRRVNGSIPANP